MRSLLLSILLGSLLGGVPGLAQEKVVQTFDGTGALATPAFQVQD